MCCWFCLMSWFLAGHNGHNGQNASKSKMHNCTLIDTWKLKTNAIKKIVFCWSFSKCNCKLHWRRIFFFFSIIAFDDSCTVCTDTKFISAAQQSCPYLPTIVFQHFSFSFLVCWSLFSSSFVRYRNKKKKKKWKTNHVCSGCVKCE